MSMAAEPRVWKYVLSGLLLALVAVPLWSLLVLWGLRPEYLLQENETMSGLRVGPQPAADAAAPQPAATRQQGGRR